MKTVGIITVHHFFNYGSVLQAYATQRIFEKLGYNAYIIDYRSPDVVYATNKFIKYEYPDDSYHRQLERMHKNVRQILKFILGKILGFRLSSLMGLKNADILSSGMGLKLSRRYNSLRELYEDPPIYDVYVVGSDQVWNTNITYNNPAYFLSFANFGKRIAYSTSIGIPYIPREALADFKKGLQNLSAILLRETEAVSYVKSLGFTASWVLDPTLMLSKEEWKSISNRDTKIPYKNYVLAYFLDVDEYCFNLLETVSLEKSLPIIYIGKKNKKFSDKYYYTGILTAREFLSFFLKADVIVTNSFHGMAFALNFNKILVATYRGKESSSSMNSRHRTLIEKFNLFSNIYSEDKDVSKISYWMDFADINNKLYSYRIDSIKHLEEALK